MPRTARAARVLAALLVPLVALPALTGLVMCVSDSGVTTSWGKRPCPKKGSAAHGLALTSPADAASTCIAVPDGPDAPLASTPDLRAPAPHALPAFAAARVLPRATSAPLPDGPRGPPSGTLGALRTIVLRV